MGSGINIFKTKIKLCFYIYIYIYRLISYPKVIHFASVRKTDLLVTYGNVVAAYSRIYVKHVNERCGHNTKFKVLNLVVNILASEEIKLQVCYKYLLLLERLHLICLTM
jgi:hypothetical protein